MKKPEPCALTPKQEQDWERTRAALVWVCPAFTHIFYTMLDNANSKHIALFTKDVPIAATDGNNLLLNPDTFFKYDLNERVFICAHEIMHCILDHCNQMWRYHSTKRVAYPDGSSLEYIQEIANVAMDLVINDLLIDSRVGTYNKDWLHDKNFGTMNDAWVDVYKKVFKQAEKNGQALKDALNGKRFDEHLQPGTSQGKDPGKAAGERNQTAWQNAIAGAHASAKAQGKLPAGLDRLFSEVLEPAVDWKEKIKALFLRRIGSDGFDWRKPDRRFISRPDTIYMPARSGFGCGTVVVGVDTSGSVGEKELCMFFAEMQGILDDCQPRELIVMWCDASVEQVDHLQDSSDLHSVRNRGVKGGGGTSFIPVFDKVAELGIEPDCLVYLTDGMGCFPERAPSYSVIWGNITPQYKYPWGDVVDVPCQA